ncbi:hypothetical protein OEG84_05780 [Hoeflea sp. G2-23]|uniref:Uncharacterized protein n=1 Tax=Hoeflea algicola TaxID=2983763 RepID=A0ABT3Z639_9HYPH|nr:hypothetical protein [Hoeflea algicola]MCY0147234.1 hypothetical protein [Hoeflea algicola]
MTTHIPGADAIKWLQTRTQTIFDGKTGDGVTSVTYSTLFARSPQFEPVGRVHHEANTVGICAQALIAPADLAGVLPVRGSNTQI